MAMLHGIMTVLTADRFRVIAPESRFKAFGIQPQLAGYHHPS